MAKPFRIVVNDGVGAGRPLDPAAYPDADPRLPVPGSLVFFPVSEPVDPRRLARAA